MEGLFKQIVDECSEQPGIIRLLPYLMNEPLLDKKIVERINYLKTKLPWAAVHILSNGTLLDDQLTDDLLDSGLDWIGFSVHAIRSETYSRITGLHNFPEIRDRLVRFIDRAYQKGKSTNYIEIKIIKVDSILSPEEKDDCIRFWKSKGIKRIVCHEDYISRAGNVKRKEPIHHEKTYGCKTVWANRMIHVLSNGDVIPCCMDWEREVILGNVHDRPLQEIWLSDAYEQFRNMCDGKLESPDDFLCKRCEDAITIGPNAGKTILGKMRVNPINTSPRAGSGPVEHEKREGSPDILLLMCPPWQADVPPLGIAYLCTYLRTHGFHASALDLNVKIFRSVDQNLKTFWDMQYYPLWANPDQFRGFLGHFEDMIPSYLQVVMRIGAPVIGFSVNSGNLLFSLEMARRIKAQDSLCTIVLGGPGINEIYSQEQGRFSPVDLFVFGEGEERLRWILARSKGKRDFQNKPTGVIGWMEGLVDGHHLKLSAPDLKQVPFPTFEEFDLSDYIGEPMQPPLPMLMSRGCIRKCSFCNDHNITKPFRSIEPKRVLGAMRYYINRYGIRQFCFNDLLINGNLKMLEQFCDLIIKSGLDVEWWGQAAVRKDMDFKLFNKMKQSGCVSVVFGVESFSDSVLQKMRKPYRAEDALHVLRNCHKAGVQTSINLIMGFPGEGEEEFLETYDFLRTHHHYIGGLSSVTTCCINAGTALFDEAKSLSIQYPKGVEPHLKWIIPNENNYSIRANRAKRIVKLTKELGISLSFLALYEGEDEGAEEPAPKENQPAGRRDSTQKKPAVSLVLLPPWGIEFPPLGLAYLATSAKRCGWSTHVLDLNIRFFQSINEEMKQYWELKNLQWWENHDRFGALWENLEKPIEEALQEIHDSGAEIVGFSVHQSNISLTLRAAKRMKEQWPDTVVLFGGPGVRWMEDIREANPGLVDLFVLNEGELTLQEILGRHARKIPLKGIPGTLYFESGSYKAAPNRSLITDLGSLPFPTYEEFDLESYTTSFLGILGSRGCINHCAFCNDREFSGHYRSRSAEHIIQEMRHHMDRYGCTNFQFNDLLINGNLAQLRRLCEEIVSQRLPINWSGQAVVRKDMNEDLFHLLRRAGCSGIVFGVESFSDPVLRAMGKPYLSDHARQVMSWAKKAGLMVVLNLIVGFPNETEEDFEITLRSVRENKGLIDKISSLSTCIITPKCLLEKNPDDYSLNLPQKDHWREWSRGNLDYRRRKERLIRMRKALQELGIPLAMDNLYEETLDIPYCPESRDQKSLVSREPERKPESAVCFEAFSESWKGQCPQRVVLIHSPPAQSDCPPESVARIATGLRVMGAKVKVVDVNTSLGNRERCKKVSNPEDPWPHRPWVELMNTQSGDWQALLRKALGDHNREMAVVFVPEYGIEPALYISREIKALSSEVFVLLIGPGCAIFRRRMSTRGQPVDGVILDDPLSVFKWWRKLSGETKTIPGLIQPDATASLLNVGFPPAYMQKQFVTSYEGFDQSVYSPSERTVRLSFGCTRRCRHCTLWPSPIFSSRNPELVAAELCQLHEQTGISSFQLLGVANGDMDHLTSLCEQFIERGSDFNLQAQFVLGKEMKTSLFQKMHQAGFKKLSFCFGSASQRIQRGMNLGFTSRLAKRDLGYAKEAGFITELNHFVGFPGEDEKDFLETLMFFREHGHLIDNVIVSPCPLRPGSELERAPERFGIHIMNKMPLSHWHDGCVNNLSYRRKKTKEAILYLESLGIATIGSGCESIVSNEPEAKKKVITSRLHQKVEYSKPAGILLATLPPWGYSNPPLGLAFLSEYLKSKGHRTIVRDYNIQFYNEVSEKLRLLWHVENKNYWSSPETYQVVQYGLESQIRKCVDDILSINSIAVGFSVVDPKERITLEVIRRIREQDPRRIIFLGGPACTTAEYRSIFEGAPKGWIHGYFLGEGEESLEAEIRAMKEERGLIEIPGVILANSHAGGSDVSWVNDLEGIPALTFEDFQLDAYEGGGKSIVFQWSRGCIGNCAYCKGRLLEGPYRCRSVDVILKEMEYALERYGIGEFTVCDSVLNGRPPFLEKVCDKIVARGLDLGWRGQIIPLPSMNRDRMKKLAQAGCKELQLGLESGSNAVLEKMRKRRLFSVEQAQEVVRDAHDAGIRTALFTIVGFPGESVSDFDETIAFVQRNADWIDEIKSINTLHIITGTELHLHSEKYGLKLPERDYHYLWEGPDGNTEEERNRRAKELLALADELKIPVRETNFREGKQYDLITQWKSDGVKGMSMRLERLLEQSKAIHHGPKVPLQSSDSSVAVAEREKSSDAGPVIRGIASGKEVYAGPELLEIDLTNNCNLQCIGCWCHSPLLGNDKFGGEKKRKQIPKETVFSLLEEARALGTGEVQLSGAGEPFLHPGIWDIIETIKESGMSCNLITNFSLLGQGEVRRLIDLGVDSITASIWAGDEETYNRIHPGVPKDLFNRIRENLSLLTKLRKPDNLQKLKIYHVVNSINVDCIESMITFALDVGADAVEFQMIDIVPGKTDDLRPDLSAQERLLAQFDNIRHRPDYIKDFIGAEHLRRLDDQILREELMEFGRLYSHLPGGFSYFPHHHAIRCPNGIGSAEKHILKDDYSVIFVFEQEECQQCYQKKECWENLTESGRLRLHPMEILGVGSFLRRLSSSEKEIQKYEGRIIDRLPCTVGWTYARVKVDGNVIPCCKASGFPLGNIFEDSFSNIWHSHVYSEFRKKAKELSKKDPYFSKINCYKSCDNVGMNMNSHLKLR